MKKNVYLIVLAFLAVVTLTRCLGGGGGGGGEPGSSVLLATGGAGSTGAGGTGGQFLVETTGITQVLNKGTVDVSYTSSVITSLGTCSFIVSGGTLTVQQNSDAVLGGLYTRRNDSNLYKGNGDGKLDANDPVVTGIIVNAGATLVLVDQFSTGYANVRLSNDFVVNGTVTTDASLGLYLDANIIDVEGGGTITASSTAPDTSAKEIHLGSGQNLTMQVINRGTIEAKGTGSGNGGAIFINADNLVIHEGTLDTSGGSSVSGHGGNSGKVDISVNFGDFNSSGIVYARGGDCGNGPGGIGGNVQVKAAVQGVNNTMKGDIVIGGKWDINAGNGTDGNGGSAGSISFETDAMGAVLMNWTFSAKGGNSLRSPPVGTAYSGGNGGSLSIASYNSSNSNVVSPGKIAVAGQLDVRGGDGELNGGDGGSIAVRSRGSNAGHKGIGVEFLGLSKVNLNGGTGVIKGGNGYNPAFIIHSFPPELDQIISDLTGTLRGKVIVNQAAIEAKGGNAAGTGGMGGYVEMKGTMSNNLPNSSQPATPATELIAGIGNEGNIDVSGGNGEIGGSAYDADGGAVYFVADYVLNRGSFKARGGDGAMAGGNGGNIVLFSYVPPTVNKGTADMAGGTGGNTLSGTLFVDGNPI